MINEKCPKCGSKSFQLFVDYHKIGYIYEVKEGKVSKGQDNSSDLLSIHCLCKECGHHWNPRNLEFEIDE